MISGSQTHRIEPRILPKIWGSSHTEPWFKAGPDGIGEVWFEADKLLIKFIFTSENLSVQVHPDDEYARTHENSRGKTEMWHVLRADPGARIGLGFQRPISTEQMMSEAESGGIFDLLNWIEASPGDTYFIPAGTVHAIGGGLVLCEIQQNSDVTYRLFDYGRGRELHLPQAKAVADCGCHPGKSLPKDLGGGLQLLVDCSYFRTYRAQVDTAGEIGPGIGARWLVVLTGGGSVNGLEAPPGSVFDGGSSPKWFLEPSTAVPMDVLLVVGAMDGSYKDFVK